MYDERRFAGERAAYRRMGMEEGFKEGLAEGRAEGILEGKAEIVRKMYYDGMKKEHIIELTGLSITEIDMMLSK